MYIAGYWARISGKDTFLDEYCPVESADQCKATCYINSQAGQAFAVEVGMDSGDWEEDIRFRLYTDGHLLLYGTCPRELSTFYSLSEVRVSPTESRAIEFSDYHGEAFEDMDIDDDDDLTEMNEYRGNITLELDRIKIHYTGEMAAPSLWTPDVLSMKTVRLGQTTKVEAAEVPRRVKTIEPLEKAFAIFQWQHRDRDFLERYQFIRGSRPANTLPSDPGLLPHFAELSLTARTLTVDELASSMSGMAVSSSRAGGS